MNKKGDDRMNKNILIFISRILCYESNRFFVSEMERQLQDYGYEVEVCEIDLEDNEIESTLMGYIGKNFDAIIDFNSALPRLVLEDGSRYLDQINAPFFNYIVDHPLYHHPVIKLDLNCSNVICIDRKHEEYIKKYYSNIHKVIFMPLGAMKALNVTPYEQRKIEVLFSGSYQSSSEMMDQMKAMNANETIFLLIKELQKNTNQTQEEALKKILEQRGETISGKAFADCLNTHYLAERYVRACFREKLIQTLLDHHINITVYGTGWEDFKCSNKEHLIIKNSVSFPVSLEIIADSKIVLNIMPWFKDGIHDRVLSAMVNGAVCVTDSSTYMKDNFKDEEEIVYYSLDELDKLPKKIEELLNNPMQAKRISECGYKVVKEKHMWKNRIEENIDKIIN